MVEIIEGSVFPLSLSEICDKLKTILKEEAPNLKIRVTDDINKLLKHNEIKAIKLDRLLAKKFFNCNHSMRLYYL